MKIKCLMRDYNILVEDNLKLKERNMKLELNNRLVN